MKNLINKINQEMRESGDIWQITKVNCDETISMETNDFVEMIVDLAFNKELQKQIQDAQISMDSEEQYLQDNMDEEDWYLPCFSDKQKITEFMSIYRDFKVEKNKAIEDDDIPF